MESNQGLNGFRSWWKKHRDKIKAVLSLAGPIGALIVAGVDIAIGNRIDYNYDDIPLTATEEQGLDDYIDNEFIPYYNDTISLVEGVELSHNRSNNLAVVTNINTAFRRIALLRTYLTYQDQNPPFNYTPNMLTARRRFVNEYLGYLYTALTNYGVSKGIDVSNTAKVEFIASAITNEAGISFLWRKKTTALYNKVLTSDDNSDEVADANSDIILYPPPKDTPLETPLDTPTTKPNNSWLKVTAIIGLSYVVGKVLSKKK